jgi:hypothetical protein
VTLSTSQPLNASTIAAAIEAFLLENHRWVKSDELCEKFEIRPRELRALGERPGICSEFAISSDKGFKHVKHASETEFMHSYRRVRKHGIAELIGARRRRRYRDRLLIDKPPPVHEVATGQEVMAI